MVSIPFAETHHLFIIQNDDVKASAPRYCQHDLRSSTGYIEQELIVIGYTWASI